MHQSVRDNMRNLFLLIAWISSFYCTIAFAQFQNREDAIAQRDIYQTKLKSLQKEEAAARLACSKELLAKQCEAKVKTTFAPQRTELKARQISANQYLRNDKANAAAARSARNEAAAKKRAEQAQARAQASQKRRVDHEARMKVKDAKRAEKIANGKKP